MMEREFPSLYWLIPTVCSQQHFCHFVALVLPRFTISLATELRAKIYGGTVRVRCDKPGHCAGLFLFPLWSPLTQPGVIATRQSLLSRCGRL